MILAPTLLLYRTGFSPTNGTSVQLERLFRGNEDKILQVMWDSSEGGLESVRWVVDTSIDLEKRRGLGGRVGRGYELLRATALMSLWKARWIKSSRLKESLAAIPIQPAQAYITCYGEREAAKAFSLWTKLGRPRFVFHVFDLFDTPVTETRTPNFFRLVQAASHVLCLNGLIEKEMNLAGAKRTSTFALCSDLPRTVRSFQGDGLRILISGTLYADKHGENYALKLLKEAWPELEIANARLELHYSGRSSWAIPKALRPFTHDHGLLPWDEYEKLMRSCHVAYVPVTHQEQSRLRFSIPSRIPDYLASGLPIIASTLPNTAVDEFLASTPRECARGISDAAQLVSAIQELSGNAERWEKASLAALQYSREAFAIESAQERLIEALNEAGACARSDS